MKNTIIRETRALAFHRRLFRRLGGRLDICNPAALSSADRRLLHNGLVAGLDYDAEPGTGGLHLPTGGRYRKLCFSPSVQGLANSTLSNLGVHELPATEEDYLDYVYLTTGIALDCEEEMDRLYRFNASMLFRATRLMRQDQPQAWRLLLSNEFSLATKVWPALRNTVAGSRFKYPLIDGFRCLAEFERGSLIMRHLARAGEIIDRPRLLAALQSHYPLASQFSPEEIVEVYRLLEYASLSTKAISNLVLDLKPRKILTLPSGYIPWAAARGSLPVTTETLFDDRQFRTIMVGVFTLPRRPDGAPDRRREMLRDDKIVRWYGMTNEVLPVLILEGARKCFPIRRAAAVPGAGRYEDYRPALAKVAGSMRRTWDPNVHNLIEQASQTYIQTDRLKGRHVEKGVTLEANLRLGSRRSKTYLPTSGRLGAAPRFDPHRWSDPYADKKLWSMFLGHTQPSVRHNIAAPERQNLNISMTVLGRAFAPIFGNAEPSSENLEIACQMAAAYSAISANPQIAFSIAQLDICPERRKRLGTRERGPG